MSARPPEAVVRDRRRNAARVAAAITLVTTFTLSFVATRIVRAPLPCYQPVAHLWRWSAPPPAGEATICMDYYGRGGLALAIAVALALGAALMSRLVLRRELLSEITEPETARRRRTAPPIRGEIGSA